MKIKLCCHIMEWHVYDAGRRGYSILPKKNGDTYQFVMQGRSHDEGGEIEGAVVESSPIHFCPSCGKNLDKFIKKNKKAIAELAELYKHLTNAE